MVGLISKRALHPLDDKKRIFISKTKIPTVKKYIVPPSGPLRCLHLAFVRWLWYNDFELPTTAFVSPRNMMKPKVIIKVVNFQVDRQFSRQFHLKIPSVIWQTTVFQSIEGQLLPQCMRHFSHSFHKNLHKKCSKIWKKWNLPLRIECRVEKKLQKCCYICD